jgi:hypothetical protein
MTNFFRCVKCLTFALLISQFEIVELNILAEEQATFHKDVADIFEQHCLRCHSSQNAKGGLSLSTRSDIAKGGESGKLVFVNRPDESLLIDMVSGSNPSMPAEGIPLTATEIAVLQNWIAAGAQWPDDLELHDRIRGGKDWWSFQPIQSPLRPDVKDTYWSRNELDRFILAKLEAENLSPSPEADRRTLIRRLSFDLLGLPPDPMEINAFIADDDPLAYERLVDRMLESTHYGERWARHWMDIAHYADTHGFERDQLRNHAWR